MSLLRKAKQLALVTIISRHERLLLLENDMDFGFSADDGNRYTRHLTRFEKSPDLPTSAVPELGFGGMLDRIEKMMDADPALHRLFAARFADRFAKIEQTKVSLAPFPTNLGTVELSVWDNQPHGRRVKVEGDKSRDKPARYAIDVRACSAGHAKPLTTKTPDFRANVGDLFTSDQVRARIKRAWKGIDPAEAAFLTEQVLPIADHGYLVARLCYKRSKLAGGGTHWHAFHYALVSEQQVINREIEAVVIITPTGSITLPRCSTLDAKGKPFPMKTKTTASGSNRDSVVIGQSRATDLASAGMKSWATGAVQIS